MRIVGIETLIERGHFPSSDEWHRIDADIRAGIAAVDWPPGSGLFTIRPERYGNGVKPIKSAMMALLESRGWTLEKLLDIATVKRPGKLDAVLETSRGPFAVEWETGNISSSHRALNKMALGMLHRKLIGGTLIVSSRELYQYLTHRASNFAELEPYFDLWKAIPCEEGLLQIVIMQHDATSLNVPPIPKGTDGRARG